MCRAGNKRPVIKFKTWMMRKQSAGVLGVLKSQRGATSPQATVGSESASWNTASYWSDRTNSLAWDGEDERKGKPVNQELDIINEFIMALSQWAQRECDRLCFLSVSYFLNCSWKRSLWPWRVSAGRPARTHTHTHTHTHTRKANHVRAQTPEVFRYSVYNATSECRMGMSQAWIYQRLLFGRLRKGF